MKLIRRPERERDSTQRIAHLHRMCVITKFANGALLFHQGVRLALQTWIEKVIST